MFHADALRKERGTVETLSVPSVVVGVMGNFFYCRRPAGGHKTRRSDIIKCVSDAGGRHGIRQNKTKHEQGPNDETFALNMRHACRESMTNKKR